MESKGKEIRQKRFLNYHYLTLRVRVSGNEGGGRGGECSCGTATVFVLEHGSGFDSEHGFTETTKMNKYDLPCTSLGFSLT